METNQTPDAAWLANYGFALPAGAVIDNIRVEVIYTLPEETDAAADEPIIAKGRPD